MFFVCLVEIKEWGCIIVFDLGLGMWCIFNVLDYIYNLV